MNNLTMKYLSVILFLNGFLFAVNAPAQKSPKADLKKISLKAEHWSFKPETVEFLEYKSVPSMKIKTSSDPVVLKDLDFTNGTIEYDMEPVDQRFTAFYFRRKDANENECFYFRTARAGDTKSVDAIQYAPHLSGINIWDMLYHFQAPADFKRETWNHVKLVISGQQMKAYVNNLSVPALEVVQMEGNVTSGGIAFDGQVIISNLVIKPNDVAGLTPEAGADPTRDDINYLRKWKVNNPITTPPSIDFSYDFLPKKDSVWQTIEAERRGLINLTRKFGKSDGRRIVWLKTTLTSATNQSRTLSLGFSDDVWVIINGNLLYLDKNWYFHPIRKDPDGRCTIQNTSFKLPLNAGNNELMIGVANDFYGWGIVARLDSVEGLTIE
jgi:hypothetical protein